MDRLPIMLDDAPEELVESLELDVEVPVEVEVEVFVDLAEEDVVVELPELPLAPPVLGLPVAAGAPFATPETATVEKAD